MNHDPEPASDRAGFTQPPTSLERRSVNTIGLCMIVKNEAHVITRCLDSVRPLLDYVLIEDTGSTDGTQTIIRDWLTANHIPGRVVDVPWRDFAYNRTHVMGLLREQTQVEYALIIDADDTLVFDDGFDAAAFKASMTADTYDMEIHHGGIRHHRPQIVRNAKAFCFKGALHEYIETPPDAAGRETAKGFHMLITGGGARSQDPRKFQRDAELLERALLEETDPFLRSRYTFYLAQSYRDCHENEKALTNYLARAEMGFWQEEVYMALYDAAKMMERLDRPEDEVIAAYLRAADAQPRRAEALHGAALYCRIKGRNQLGYEIAARGIDMPVPDHGLFLEHWIYEYGLLDEYAINGYWSGHYKESLDACLRILATGKLSGASMKRVVDNARFASEKLPKGPTLAVWGQDDFIAQHDVGEARALRTRLAEAPKVFVSILAKQKEAFLPLYLDCIEALDYPKSSIFLYIRTNNNTDQTEEILRDWVDRVGHQYAGVEFDAEDVTDQVQRFGVHEWNPTRFRVLGRIRNISMRRALEEKCDFYFVADVDNFVRPCTLKELVALNLPVVAPFLRSIAPGGYYSNYHSDLDPNGYFKSCDQYHWILQRSIRGVLEQPVVHCTYLIRADVIEDLTYEDDTNRYEYVVFSDSARKAGVVQYLDNRQIYGYITFDEGADNHVPGGIDKARALLKMAPASPAVPARPANRRSPSAAQAKNHLFACFGLHSSGSTWMFNLVREICRASNINFISAHRDGFVNLPRDEAGTALIIAKTHAPWDDYIQYIAENHEPAVLTIRDPRDAIVSLMQRFPETSGKTFETALQSVAWDTVRLLKVQRALNLPVFRYEDQFVGSNETFEQIARMLGVTISLADRDSILAGLEPGTIRRHLEHLANSGVINGEKEWDRESHWHANHVGDGRIEKYRDFLTEEQSDRVVEQTREFMELFGYGTDSRLPLDRGTSSNPAVAQTSRAGSPAQPAVEARSSSPAVGKRRLFACFGLQRSGSTWMFNLVREICHAAGIDHLSQYRESVDNLGWAEAGSRLIVSKSHSQWGNYIPFFAANDAKGVITVRDPQDAVASLMERRLEGTEHAFEGAMADVVHSARRQLVFSRELSLPVFRYEDGFVGRPDTFNKIAAMLDVTLPDTTRDEILAKLAPDSVREILKTLESAARELGREVWDHDPAALGDVALAPPIERLIEGQWHPNHIGDGRTGKFRDVLTAEQEATILERTAEFRRHFGYEELE
jgi:Glycosyl transferase family 2/Anp1/Sulfotransferase domain